MAEEVLDVVDRGIGRNLYGLRIGSFAEGQRLFTIIPYEEPFKHVSAVSRRAICNTLNWNTVIEALDTNLT